MPQVQIAGNVNLIGWEGKKVSVWESFNVNGKEYSRLWTCWFSESMSFRVNELDWVEIHGELSTKIGSYKNKAGEEKQVVEHHIQNAQLVQVRTKEQQAQTAEAFDNLPF